jgi:hypothetical protein
MNSYAPAAPDYCARALALWPRLERGRLARIRHDPKRVASLISRRTTLSYDAILELLGAPPAPADTADDAPAASPARDH